MGLCLGKTAASAWPDLPVDIAGEILSRLLSHDDRVSFKAVCRNWRIVAQQHRPPPATPCINLGNGTYQSMAGNGEVHRFATPRRGYNAGASFGSWLLYDNKTSRRCFLGDPFLRATPAVELPCHYHRPTDGGRKVVSTRDRREACWHLDGRYTSEKIVVCSPNLVIAIFDDGVFKASTTATLNFACLRPGTTPLSWSNAATSGYQSYAHGMIYKDIAFHRGKIYAISWTEHLFAHEVDRDVISRSRIEHVIKDPIGGPFYSYSSINNHLVTSSDKQKLFMVRWSIPSKTNSVEVEHRAMNLRVFEADLDRGRWAEVNDLDRQVLFIGGTGSKALAVENSSETIFKGGNRVFILGDDWAQAWRQASLGPCRCRDCQNLINGIPSYCVYDMRSGETSLVSLNGVHSSMKSFKSEWFFPSQ